MAGAYVALGIAKVQSARRQVTIADLVGDIGPLVSLVSGGDPHGIVDSFVYGVSINKIARPVDGNANLVILPSGTEPVAQQEILASPRWRRLTNGYKEVGALLLTVAETNAPGLDALIAGMEGVVLVGETTPREGWRVFGTARPERPRTTRSTAAVRTSPGQRPETRPAAAKMRRILIGAGAVVLLGIAALWLTRSGTPPAASPDSSLVAVNDSTVPDSFATDSAFDAQPGDSGAPPVAIASPVTADGTPTRLLPEDSVRAVPYSVLVVSANTEESAMLRLQAGQGRLPPGTFSPVIKGNGALWYEVIVGAYTDRRRAQELLTGMRATRALGDSGGYVVRVPYTLLVRDNVSTDTAATLVAGLTSVGLPVFSMRQSNGRMRVYAGAFEAPEQADRLARSLRVAGVEPVVVYRIGRPF